MEVEAKFLMNKKNGVSEVDNKSKLAYKSPHLRDLGDIRDLTLGSSGTPTDSPAPGSAFPRPSHRDSRSPDRNRRGK